MTDVQNEFADALKRIRRTYFCSQLGLAAEVRRSVPAVSQWETRKKVPSGNSMLELKTALDRANAPSSEAEELYRLWYALKSRSKLAPRASNRKFRPDAAHVNERSSFPAKTRRAS